MLPDLAAATPRARAEAATLLTQVRDVAKTRFPTLQSAEDQGYKFALYDRKTQERFIHQGLTDVYHLTNSSYIHDDRIMDPQRPESLVYRPMKDGHLQLVALMFRAWSDQLPPKTAKGILFWHIHRRRLNWGQTPAKYSLGKTIMAHVWLTDDLKHAYQTAMP
jgi:hypothetical protein